MSEYNTADVKQVKKREEKDKNERDQELEDIKTILKTPSGERFFRKLFEDGRVLSTSNTGVAESTFFNEGWRAFALKHFADVIEAVPNKLQTVLTKEL